MINKILTGVVYDAEDERAFRSILVQIGITEDEFFGRPSVLKPSPKVDTPPAPSKVPFYGDIPAGHATAVEPEDWVDPLVERFWPESSTV